MSLNKEKVKTIKCPKCGAPIIASYGTGVIECEYCGSKVENPFSSKLKIINNEKIMINHQSGAASLREVLRDEMEQNAKQNLNMAEQMNQHFESMSTKDHFREVANELHVLFVSFQPLLLALAVFLILLTIISHY